MSDNQTKPYSSELIAQLQQLQTHCHITQVQQVNPYLYRVCYQPHSIDCYYNSQRYELKLMIPEEYPEKPPYLAFLSQIYHLNVHPVSGFIHLEMLLEDWSPFITLYHVIESLDSLLIDPDVNYPAEEALLREYTADPEVYWDKVATYCFHEGQSNLEVSRSNQQASRSNYQESKSNFQGSKSNFQGSSSHIQKYEAYEQQQNVQVSPEALSSQPVSIPKLEKIAPYSESEGSQELVTEIVEAGDINQVLISRMSTCKIGLEQNLVPSKLFQPCIPQSTIQDKSPSKPSKQHKTNTVSPKNQILQTLTLPIPPQSTATNKLANMFSFTQHSQQFPNTSQSRSHCQKAQGLEQLHRNILQINESISILTIEVERLEQRKNQISNGKIRAMMDKKIEHQCQILERLYDMLMSLESRMVEDHSNQVRKVLD